jgi:hypothetical protein
LRVLGGVYFRGSFEFELFFGLPLVLPFVSFAVFLLIDYLLEVFFGFWSSSCA